MQVPGKQSEAEANEWFCGALQTSLEDWGLTVSMQNIFTGFTAIPAVVADSSWTKITRRDADSLPSLAELREDAQAHFIAETVSTETELGNVLNELEAAGQKMTQTASEDRTDKSGQVTALWKTYVNPDGISVRFVLDPDTGHIGQIVITDSKLVTDSLPLSLKAVAKLKTPSETTAFYQALVRCASLGLTDPDGLAAFDLQWTTKETTDTEHAVRAAVQAGNATVELHRYTWRIGGETFTSQITMTIE